MKHHQIIKSLAKSIVVMSIGCLIFAIGFNLFIFPLGFLTGGVTGISIIINKLTNINPAYTQWALNIPLFVLGWIVLGHTYAVKITYGSFFLPFMVKLTENLNQVNVQLPNLISLILGSILLGLGLGIILGVNGSTGGLDIPARILSQVTKISLGVAIGLVDMIVIVSGAFVYQILDHNGLMQGLYALICLLLMTVMIDLCTIHKPGQNLFKTLLVRKNTY
jgi:uncharacterized membrane-anchored protein YitT (DUF2179 family)